LCFGTHYKRLNLELILVTTVNFSFPRKLKLSYCVEGKQSPDDRVDSAKLSSTEPASLVTALQYRSTTQQPEIGKHGIGPSSVFPATEQHEQLSAN
jgi:hypothetical protein